MQTDQQAAKKTLLEMWMKLTGGVLERLSQHAELLQCHSQSTCTKLHSNHSVTDVGRL